MSKDVRNKENRAEIEKKLSKLKKEPNLSSFERVEIARHPDRPKASDFIQNLFNEFLPLSGDRLFREDPAILGGFARIGNERCMVIAQEKGKDTQSRIHHNFGSPHPEGYRKALRLAQLAEKFKLPLIFLVDTPGAFPGIAAEERGQGWAIAHNLRELFRIETPIIVLILGEGCSGGALGIGIGDSIGMLEHAYFSVITPEGCASILWRDASKKQKAAEALRLHAEDMLEFGIIEKIIEEGGGAHLDPHLAFNNTKKFILSELAQLKKMSCEYLLERRYQKFRKIGSHVA